MAIQILGLRQYVDKNGKIRKSVKFLEKGWRSPSIKDLLDNIDHHIEQIPENERFNIQFTIADCLEEKGRKMQKQNCIFFDIDNIDVSRAREYIEVVSEGIGLPSDYLSFIVTGHGLHVIVQFQEAWDSIDFYDTYKAHYRAICMRINQKLLKFPLVGFADDAVFADTRMVRMPKTMNVKPDKEPAPVELIHHKLTPINMTLDKLISLENPISKEDQIAPQVLKTLPIDSEAVLDKCGFLQHCKQNQAEVREPEWYAMLSIVSRLKEGEKIAHEFSKEHPSYDEAECDLKIEQAKFSSGPRSCQNISNLYDKCKSCPSWGKVRSPIMLKNEDFIRTEATGFRNVGHDKSGALIRKAPNYDDLLKYFQKVCHYKVEKQSSSIYVYKDGVYSMMERLELENFAETHINPAPVSREVTEFVKKVQRTNLVSHDFFTVEGSLNCGNGILDLKTFELSPHSPEYGFTYKLNYDYQEDAVSPRFDKFLMEVCSGSEEKANLIMEYMGYALSATNPVVGQKALILVGDGANGKSVLVETFGKLVGESNYTTLTMADLRNEQMRAILQHKLFNLSEETPKRSLYESSEFKNLVTGGRVRAKIVHKPPFEFNNITKFIFCCNELPKNFDTTYGMNRRLLLVRFKEEFTFAKGNCDPLIHDKLEGEMSGILNRVIDGYKRFADKNRFTSFAELESEIEEYALENNTVAQWCGERCDIDESSADLFSLQDLYFDYQNWMRETNPAAKFELQPRNMFGKLLSAHIPKLVKRRIGRQKTTYYRGLIPVDDSIAPKINNTEI